MRVLLTAFEPYGEWPTNSSWMALVDLLRIRPPSGNLVTRRYPVDFARMQNMLMKDLAMGFDAVLHLGQAPGSATVRLEAIAVNAGGSIVENGQGMDRLVSDGPEAYRSSMPLDRWSQLLQKQSIPAQISYHAGTYLCNAIMYLSHHWSQHQTHPIRVGFVHLPLASEQVAGSTQALPSLPVGTLAQAIGTILEDLENIEQFV